MFVSLCIQAVETHLNYGVSLHRRFCYIFLLVDCRIVKVVASSVSSHCHGCCILSDVSTLFCCNILSFVDRRIVDVVTSLSLCIAKFVTFIRRRQIVASSNSCDNAYTERRPHIKQPWYLRAPLHWHGHRSRQVVIVTDCGLKLGYYPSMCMEEGLPGRSTVGMTLTNWHRRWWRLSVVDQLKS